jgi:CheY-like chemotaxis protein
MDHMMPGMDGLEATEIIRAMKGREAMPIVALTANAISGMREMFLRNGFDDFLSKPIQTSALAKIMEKWISPDKRRPAADEGAQPAAREQEKPPAIEGVDVQAGLDRIGGSPNRYLDLLAVFRRDVADGFHLLEKEPDELSLLSFTTLVHALKSALSNIGADGLSQTAFLLEKAGRAADTSLIREVLPAFRTELSALTARIGEYTASARPPEDEDRVTPEIGQAAEQLANALEAGDVDAMDAALAQLQSLPLSGKQRAAVSEIGECVLTAEFHKALDAVSALRGQRA